MRDCKSIWKAVLSEIELEVSRANFFTLFKQTHLLSIEGSVATIAAPSGMIIDLLQRKFFAIIKNASDHHIGNDTKIVFVPKTVVDEIVDNKDDTLFSEEAIKTTVGHLPRVRPDYTFENMAVSGSNQLAFVSATTVAKSPGASYNPLFIYGPVGVGKTHLMQSVANEVYSKKPNTKILYTTSEEFTNDVVEAIRTNTTGRMKKRFRELDLLIIDDIQFIAGKEKVQEELFHTFNILVDKSSQIVLSSDRHPSEIKMLEKRLISRFGGGLTVDIQSPDFELRCAILLIKAKKYGVALSFETAKIIAQKALDARGLEGLLLRIVTEAQNKGVTQIDEEMASSVLSFEKEQDTGFHPEEIIENVCTFYKVKQTQLKSPKRDAFLVRPRQIAMYLLKKQGLTFVEIGHLLGGRDHTTIMHGVEKIEKIIEQRGNMDFMGLNLQTFGKKVD
ncbi:MAG: chromosomal replication initiator protein DnaA [Candidatus Levybacteria bacterium RIFCSPHIGHO2_01_FULL_37_17]|nr:MAG: chromosomal replication initiator protein DnaA [Candidatus Levybacteria bacterium RIFCSPHIGHO2_01_FULL_37_17]OGH36436.1 MAG: chromosomal replication initiator protein DnaA [Candidatus Levybacteria bacterium RIFCSPLOWO2_01_FULL_38_23]